MIQTIELVVKNGANISLNAQVIFSKNICYINKQKYKITEEFKEEILDTICSWKHEYGTDDNADSKEFTLKVTTNNGEEYYHGKGIFPENYSILEELLSDSDE